MTEMTESVVVDVEIVFGHDRKALGNFSPRDSKRLSTRHDPWQTGHGMSWLTRHNTRVLHSGATSGAGRSMLR